MSLLRNSLLTLFGTIGRVIFSMLSQIVISRTLGPVGKGLYSFLIQIPTVLVPLSSLGINYANTYFVAKQRHEGRSAVSNSVFLATGLGSLMCIALAASFIFLRTGYFQSVTMPQIGLIMLSIPFSLLNLYWLGILWGMDRIGRYNLSLLIQFIVLATGVIILAALSKLNATTALFVWVLGNIITTIYMVPDLLQVAGNRILNFDRQYFHKTLGYGIKAYAANVMMVINYRLDVFIITGFLPMAQVGWYTTAVTLAEMAGYIGNAVNTALIPKLASGRGSLSFSSTPKICRLTILLTLLAAIGMGLLGYPLIILFFGTSFTTSYLPLLLLLPGIVALGGSTVLNGDLMARGKPIYNTIASLITVVLTLILDFTMIPSLGIKGAALASTFVYISLLAINYFFYLRESGEKLRNVILVTGDDLAEMVNFLKGFITTRLRSGR